MSVSDTAVALLGGSASVDQPMGVDGLPVTMVATTHQEGVAAQQHARDIIAPVEESAGSLRRGPRLLITLDAMIAVAATAVAITQTATLVSVSLAEQILIMAAGAVVWPLWLAGSRSYRRPGILQTNTGFRPVLLAGAAIIVPSALFATWLHVDMLMTAVAVGVPTAGLGSLATRWAHRTSLQRAIRRGAALRRSILVGRPEAVLQLFRELRHNQNVPLTVAGVCVPASDTGRATDLGLPVVGDLEHVATAAGNLGCHAVVVAGTDNSQEDSIRRLAWSLEDQDAELVLFPGVNDLAQHRLDLENHSSLPLLHLRQPQLSYWRRKLKRATDLALTSIGVLLISPLLAAIALMIKVTDRGPVIYRQSRVGINGRQFTMYKFRSMVVDADNRKAELQEQNEGAGPLFKMKDDPRVTRVGRVLRRLSLDELPQLFNVLNGSMSLVGPRPQLLHEVDAYEPHVHRRLKVLPGVTGPWQVGGRSLLSWDQTVRLDLGYVENWSLGMDLQILFKTVRAVLKRDGAF